MNTTLFEVRFGKPTNALIGVGDGVLRPGNFVQPLPDSTRQWSVVVVRQTAGQASTVPLTVADGCGAWPTFVGGGPTAF